MTDSHRLALAVGRALSHWSIAGILLAAGLLPRPVLAQRPGSPVDINSGTDAPEASGIVDIQRLAGPVTLDGMSDEAAWAGVEPLAMTMYEPEFRGVSGQRIQVLVAYDDEAIYVASRFYHEDPEEIRAFSLTRDTWNGDAAFGVLLDTFNDNENAVRFVGMPLDPLERKIQFCGAKRSIASGRNSVAGHKILCELLAPFETSSCSGGTYNTAPSTLKTVYQSFNEGLLRSYDGEVNIGFLDETDDLVKIVCGDWYVCADRRRSCITRRDK